VKVKTLVMLLLTTGAVTVMAGIVTWRPGWHEGSHLVGRPIPSLTTVTYLDGRPLTPSDWRGKVVLVSFWAIDNYTSREHLEQIRQLHGRYASDPRVQVVGFNADVGPAEAATLDEVRRFVLQRGLTYPQLIDASGYAFGLLEVEALPRDMIIGPDGIVQGIWVGHHPDAVGRLAARIEQVLSGSEPAPRGR